MRKDSYDHTTVLWWRAAGLTTPGCFLYTDMHDSKWLLSSAFLRWQNSRRKLRCFLLSTGLSTNRRCIYAINYLKANGKGIPLTLWLLIYSLTKEWKRKDYIYFCLNICAFPGCAAVYEGGVKLIRVGYPQNHWFLSKNVIHHPKFHKIIK